MHRALGFMLRNRLPLAFALIVVAAAVATFVALGNSDEAIDRAATNERKLEAAEPAVAVAKARADRAEKKVTTADRRLRVLTRIIVEKQIAVQGKDGLRGGPGPVGNVGPRGPAGVVPFTLTSVSSQVVATIPGLVAANCGGPCKGADGIDGRDVTQEQVEMAVAERIAAALAVACAGPCKGTSGADGAPAPPPTQEQVAAAVAAYCDAHNQCASTVPGPAGANGSNGTNGSDGVTTTVVVVCSAPAVPHPSC